MYEIQVTIDECTVIALAKFGVLTFKRNKPFQQTVTKMKNGYKSYIDLRTLLIIFIYSTWSRRLFRTNFCLNCQLLVEVLSITLFLN